MPVQGPRSIDPRWARILRAADRGGPGSSPDNPLLYRVVRVAGGLEYCEVLNAPSAAMTIGRRRKALKAAVKLGRGAAGTPLGRAVGGLLEDEINGIIEE